MSDLRYACLEKANLCSVNLNRANMLGARLAGARLENVDLAGAILPDGTRFSDQSNLERFTNTDNSEFAPTLEAVYATEKEDSAAQVPEGVTDDGDLSWAQFVERTYGSLAENPIEWHPPTYIENEDARE